MHLLSPNGKGNLRAVRLSPGRNSSPFQSLVGFRQCLRYFCVFVSFPCRHIQGYAVFGSKSESHYFPSGASLESHLRSVTASDTCRFRMSCDYSQVTVQATSPRRLLCCVRLANDKIQMLPLSRCDADTLMKRQRTAFVVEV